MVLWSEFRVWELTGTFEPSAVMKFRKRAE
jgi:hypothetical protein